MLYLLLGAGLLFTFFSYCFFESKEKDFINALVSPYGSFIDEISLDLFYVGGRDRLRWGSKLYLFREGMVIGEPQGGVNNIYISLRDIKGLANKDKGLIFYHKINRDNLLIKFEIGENPLQKKLAGMLNKTILQIENI